MSQNFRLFHVSNLSVRNFRIFLLMYPGPVSPDDSRMATADMQRMTFEILRAVCETNSNQDSRVTVLFHWRIAS